MDFKQGKRMFLILFSCLMLIPLFFTVSSPQHVEANGNYPVYRTYLPNTRDYFFTKNQAESEKTQSFGGVDRKIAWQMSSSGAPVYRMYNPKSGEHFYTASEKERQFIVAKGWFVTEGVLGGSQGKVPVYRFYHYGIDRHTFTADEGEKQQFIQQGYTYEGVGFYVAAKGSVIQQPKPQSKVYYLNAPNYNQYKLGAPSGCEGAALLQAEQAKGRLKGWSLRRFLDTMPRASTPYNGFVGSPYEEKYWVYSAMYPAPLTAWAKRYGNATNVSKASTDDLIGEIKRGNPSVVWVTVNFKTPNWGQWPFGRAVNNNHAVTLDGWDQARNMVHVSDSISGSYWVNKSTFESVYNARRYAVLIH